MGFDRFIEMKRTIGFALESTAYSRETLTASDFDVAAYEVQYTPNIPMYERKLAKGTFGRSVSIAGKRSIEITFKVDMHPGDAAATPPNYWKCLRACGLEQQTGASGAKLIPNSEYSSTPATIEIVEREEGVSPIQKVQVAVGCMGDATFVLSETGQPIAIECRFLGRYEGPEDRAYASLLTPTAFDTNTPPAVLSATISLFATVQFINTMRIALNNQLELFTDPSQASGYEGCRVIDRNPTAEMDPDMRIVADIDPYTSQISNTTGQLSVTVGSNMLISAPKAQYDQAEQPGAREGHVVDNIVLGLRENLGSDELIIQQGTI